MVIGGVLLIALGILWLLQGLNVIKGSGMSGTRAWAYIGPLVAVGGVLMIVSGVRGRTASRL
jgi:hypothetical protein